MNNIIKFNPKLIKKTSNNFIPTYNCSDIPHLIIRFNKLKNELKNILSLDKNKEIAFELFSLELIPSKTKRISKNCLNNLKWNNDGVRFDELEERIILVIWTTRLIIERNIIFIDEILKIINSNTKPLMECGDLIELFKNEIFRGTKTKAKDYMRSFFSFVEESYNSITIKNKLILEPEVEYISDIMCNHSLFNDDKNINITNEKKIKFTKKNIIEENTKYLINTNKNNIMSFGNNDFDDLFSQSIDDIPDATNKNIIGILDGGAPPTKNIIIKNYVDWPDEGLYHGQWVSSIAMFGDKMNKFDDGCGVFNILLCRVSFKNVKEAEVLEAIKKALEEHPHIRVWNISLGCGNSEINPFDSISYLGSELDKLSYDKDVIFVISGGNDYDYSKSKFLTTPADSLRSVIVNSLDINNEIASYSRKGKKFLNYKKPDCSIFGGDKNKEVVFISGSKYKTNLGTSFSAPFISRLICGIIEKFPELNNLEILSIFFNGLEHNDEKEEFTGSKIKYPYHIDNFIKQKDNEILLLFNGITEKNKKTIINPNFELPLDSGKFNNELKVTTICKGKIDNRYGVESIRTCITSVIGESENKLKIHNSKRVKDISEFDKNLSESELIKSQGKWSINNTKFFKIKSPKLHDNDFIKWTIKLENQNRNSTDYNELKDTQIEYAIAIKITNTANINNYDKLFSRLELLEMLPNKLIEWNIDLDQDIKLTNK